MAKSNDPSLAELLQEINKGNICLPDFQRSSVWDDEHIPGLIASITNSYPIGAVMFLETGGDGNRCRSRTFTNVPVDKNQPKKFVLDGQQRLTSTYCTMWSNIPVPTHTRKKENTKRYYI